MHDPKDIIHMQNCLRLAAQAAGRTTPNPMVGSIVLDCEGKVVGDGFHEKAGCPHAEVVALDKAGEAARGGTIYVSLEPCAHFGRTPPCADRVIKSGVKRVVAGMVDPNPLVAGKGLAALRQAGIEVLVGVLEDECRWLNRGFIKRMSAGLPWLCLKLATTLDGKIADRTGTSRWISGPEARLHVHFLRDAMDCVLVGGTTALRDDPELNVRELEGGRNPVRVVFDPDLALPSSARLCLADSGGPTIIFCSTDAFKRLAGKYPEHVRLLPIERDRSSVGYLDLKAGLAWLAGQGYSTVLCEGGGRLSSGLLSAGLVDEVQWIISPKILGDAEAVPAVAHLGEVLLSQATKLKQASYTQLGEDLLISGVVSALSTVEQESARE